MGHGYEIRIERTGEFVDVLPITLDDDPRLGTNLYYPAWNVRGVLISIEQFQDETEVWQMSIPGTGVDVGALREDFEVD